VPPWGCAAQVIHTYPEKTFRKVPIGWLAPARNEGCGKRRISKIDGDCIVDDAAPSGCHRPAIGSAIVVEPGVHAVQALAEARWRCGDPDAHRKPALGLGDHQL